MSNSGSFYYMSVDLYFFTPSLSKIPALLRRVFLFNNRFDFFHGRVHLISLVATFLSMFWPWIVADDTIDRFEILGIQTILSNIFIGLLILNILVSTLRHNKLVSIFNIIIGILCFIIVLMTFIGYYLPVSVTFVIISRSRVRQYPIRVHLFANQVHPCFEPNTPFKATDSRFEST